MYNLTPHNNMKEFTIKSETVYEIVRTALSSINITLDMCHNNDDVKQLRANIQVYETALGYTKAQYETMSEDLYVSILNVLKTFECACMNAKPQGTTEIYVLHTARCAFIQLRNVLNYISIDNNLPTVY